LVAKETLEEKRAKWNRRMAAVEQLRLKLEAWKPDVQVIVADDANRAGNGRSQARDRELGLAHPSRSR
jgi:hypothetical protein